MPKDYGNNLENPSSMEDLVARTPSLNRKELSLLAMLGL